MAVSVLSGDWQGGPGRREVSQSDNVTYTTNATVLYCSVVYCILLYCTVLYYTVLTARAASLVDVYAT